MGSAVVATSVAIASVLPKLAEPLLPTPSTITLIADLPGDIMRPAAFSATANEWKQSASEASPAVALESRNAGGFQTLSSVAPAALDIPRQGLAVRTHFAADLQNLLFRRQPEPDVRLTHLTPPYTASGPGYYEVRLAYVTGRIERSLFEAGVEAGLSDALILKLAEIFAWDIDFALDVHPGDSFSMVYEQKYWLGRKIVDGTILAAEFSNRGRVHRAIAFRGQDGMMRYYAPSGRNLRRAFLRSPVKFSQISSRFSKSRYHPILKLWRAHNGVDYAAPLGTPVLATADGRVESLGWNGGYGNTVVLDHGGAYSTLYAHLSRIPANLSAGQRVAQGDVIGYVGQTGLASGPHLHYEFRVNGQHQNPLALDLPSGEAIAPADHEDFFRVAREWIARLELVRGRYEAVASSK